MKEPSDPNLAAARRNSSRDRRIRAIRGATAALSVSLVIAFSSTVAQRADLEGTASAAGMPNSSAPAAGPSATATFIQPERLVTSQS
ncbi:MAG TPA: hypothetical protein VMF31_10835 [Solirubrobacterales bacterium]|nr:hypothetical protein [Solirubrobacterales bacterium]